VAEVPTSPVRLSSASVRTDSAQVYLTFSSSLDEAVAMQTDRYLLMVNGQAVEVEMVSCRQGTVTLSLPESTLRSGDVVRVSWKELRDAQGRLLADEEITLRVP
jgi:hypothetical protein